jgi:hypothetical protein
MTRAPRIVLLFVLAVLPVAGPLAAETGAEQPSQPVDPMTRHYLDSARFWLEWIQNDVAPPPELKTRIADLERDFGVVERAYNRVAPDAPEQAPPPAADDPHWSEAADRVERTLSAIIESGGLEDFRLHKFESFHEQFNNFLDLARPLLPPPPAA